MRQLSTVERQAIFAMGQIMTDPRATDDELIAAVYTAMGAIDTEVEPRRRNRSAEFQPHSRQEENVRS